MRETMDMQGKVRLLLEDRAGRLLLDRTHPNRIVKSGRQLVAQLFAGVEGTPPSKVTHMAVGTGKDEAKDDQVGLQAERTRNPVGKPAYTEIVDDKGVKRIKVSLQSVFDFGEANGTEPLCEAGLFTAKSDGTIYNRVTFDPVTKAPTFKLTLIWDIVF
jgi:hypothetical protein